MDKLDAPLFDKLLKHYKKSLTSFHVPGHKMGKGFNPIGRKYFKEILKLDLTELVGLDNLHQPEGVILEAEKRAATLFQADYTFFLVNGSTSGNLAMILAVCKPGDKIIVQRNVHKSVINGLILARAKPIYIDCEMIPQLGIVGGIRKSSLINALKMNQDVKAVFLTNPSYYGISINIKTISEIVHKYNIPLLVDEAHGAHFGLDSRFPNSAIQGGADVVVQSTHKTLSAMTMGSMLHVKSGYVDVDKIKMFLSMLQTSSPSYPIMASLDLARAWIEVEGEKLWDKTFIYLSDFYKKSLSFKNINVTHNFENDEVILDPLKIIIHSNKKLLSGVIIQKKLENKGIFMELADLYNTLAIISSGTRKIDIKNLYYALMRIDKEININIIEQNNIVNINNNLFSNGFKEVNLDKMLYSENIAVPILEAMGKMAAEMIIPYPPGVPVVQLGERISKEIIEYIIQLENAGINIEGVYNNKQEKMIKIINDTE